jgi:hypothetical protein
MNALELLKFIAAHPKHLETITKIIEILRSDPTLISDVTELLKAVSK